MVLGKRKPYVCEQCKQGIARDIKRRKGERVNCMIYGCDHFPNHCGTGEIFDYIMDLIEKEREDELAKNQKDL